MRIHVLSGLATAAGIAAPASSTALDTRAIEQAAHGGYVAAINSNRMETFAAMLADDVLYQAHGGPGIVGKAAGATWAKGYLDRCRTHR